MNDTILVIDDEIQIRRLLKISLEDSGYKVVLAASAKEGIQESINCRPSLILLDLGLPDDDGLNVIKQIREFQDVPVIILSVRNSEKDIIAALDSGANDYITKPFNTGELLARMRACLRYYKPEEKSPLFRNGRLEVDFASHEVKAGGNTVRLTATEFSLLALFVRNAGKVITHGYILKEVWGKPFSDEVQYLRVYIAQLRKKLEQNPSAPEMFITESGIGYRMKLVD